jgi:predicted fused transcriptional regulator/phosphomethylpyrimidine kinase
VRYKVVPTAGSGQRVAKVAGRIHEKKGRITITKVVDTARLKGPIDVGSLG